MKQVIFVLALAVLVAGCTTYYAGAAQFVTTDQDPHDTQAHTFTVYWDRTSSWFTTTKAGPIIINDCRANSLTFVDGTATIAGAARAGIYYFSGINTDIRADNGSIAPVGLVCGRVLGATRIEDLRAGPMRFTIRCIGVPPIVKSPNGNGYMKPRDNPPYQVDIRVVSAPPTCQNVNSRPRR